MLPDELQAKLIANLKEDPNIPIDEAEAKLQIEGFFNKLVSDDDWTTIVKLHALFEGVFSHLLADALCCPELLGVLSNLPMGETRYGKLKFLKELKLITGEVLTRF